MEVNEELDERAADRLLAGELAPDEVAAGYRQVATLLSAARAEPAAAELSRQADTVRAMAAARRGGGEDIGASAASWPMRLARRRSMRLGVLAAATTLSFTGLAAAGLLPGPLQSIATRVVPSLGDSPPDSEGQGAPGGSQEDPSNGPGPGSEEGGEAVPTSPSRPAEAKESGPQQAPQASPGQAKQAAKAILRAEATASGGRLVVSFQETGVGADAVTVTARADATATYGCVSQDSKKDGKKENPSKEGRVDGGSEAGSRFAALNGDSRGALTLTAPGPASVSCPSGEAPQLLRVLYSRVVVLDTTTGASTTINRTFPAEA
jgi:hypothetical protein